jgi:hypothetical protein
MIYVAKSGTDTGCHGPMIAREGKMHFADCRPLSGTSAQHASAKQFIQSHACNVQ